MRCDDVKRVVYFFLDGTLGPQRGRDFHAHVTLCPECAQRIHVQRRLRTFVQNRLERITATDRFKVRLSRSLRAMLD
jgi:hypothetical protein